MGACEEGLHQGGRRAIANMGEGLRVYESAVPWLVKFLDHGNGIAIVRAYTSAGWFHDHAVKADAMLFPRGKTKFIRPDGSVGKAPGHGIVLLAAGGRAVELLRASGLGLFVDLRGKTW